MLAWFVEFLAVLHNISSAQWRGADHIEVLHTREVTVRRIDKTPSGNLLALELHGRDKSNTKI